MADDQNQYCEGAYMFFASKTLKALLTDHKNIKEEAKKLTNLDFSIQERREAFYTLAPLLNSHNRREEQAIYAFMNCSYEVDLNEMSFEGREQHNLINFMLEEMQADQLRFEEWSAKGQVLGGLIIDHLNKEEQFYFPLIKKQLDFKSDIMLCRKYEIQAQIPYPYKYRFDEIFVDNPDFVFFNKYETQ